MTQIRKSTIRATHAVLLLISGMLPTVATAENPYPNRPVTIIVPFAPGGSTDAQARLVAKSLQTITGQPFVVENKAGASGSIGARAAALAKADGYTLLFGTTSTASETVLNKNAGFDIRTDFAPISMISNVPFMMVVSCSSGIKTISDLIKRAKDNPGKLNYASWGYGSTGNIINEMFKLATKTELTHVPYKGESLAALSMLSGETDVAFLSPVQLPQVKAGKLCPIAITGGKRMRALPDVPTMEEAGVAAVHMPMWSGVMAPAKTPTDVVTTLSQALEKALKSDELLKTAQGMSIEIIGSSPKAFREQINGDIQTVIDLSQKTRLRE
jgi:tripartite-type tricarboxylate transporter receptor subunit TctC